MTICVSMLFSAFNPFSLSPPLASLLLRPKEEGQGLGRKFFRGFNRWFARATDGYVGVCGLLIRKALRSLLFLAVVMGLVALLTAKLPSGFLSEEDRGYFYLEIQLPEAAALDQRWTRCDASGDASPACSEEPLGLAGIKPIWI